MPCYNAEKYIHESIESIIAQTIPEWELLLINDASKDRTREIIDKYAEADSRIRTFNLDQNGGAAKARNVGIENSRFKYIAFLDSDDSWPAEKLQIQIEFMEKNNVQFSFTSYYIIDNQGVVKGIRTAQKLLTYQKLITYGNDIGCLTVMYERERFKRYKFNENIRGHEDYKMWLDIVKDTKEMYALDIPLAYYRIHPGNKNLNKWRSLVWNWEVWYKYEHLGLTTVFITSVRWITFKVFQRLFVPFNLKR